LCIALDRQVNLCKSAFAFEELKLFVREDDKER